MLTRIVNSVSGLMKYIAPAASAGASWIISMFSVGVDAGAAEPSSGYTAPSVCSARLLSRDTTPGCVYVQKRFKNKQNTHKLEQLYQGNCENVLRMNASNKCSGIGEGSLAIHGAVSLDFRSGTWLIR